MKIRYVIHQEVSRRAYGVYKFRDEENGDLYWYDEKNEVWVGPTPQGERFAEGFHPKPVLIINHASIEQFQEALTSLGFTPSKISESLGELKATRSHLEDMRRLVFEEREERIEICNEERGRR